MKKSKISSVNDRLFAQATEDICEFEEAVKLWSDSTEQPTLLVDIAVGRGRGRLALARLAERDLKEDDKYLGKLDRIFSRTEGLLRDIVNAKDSFAEYLQRLKKLSPTLYGKDFLLTWDKSVAELKQVLLVAEALKHLHLNNVSARCFDTGIAVSNFRDNSTRTRFSFSSASNLLGLAVQDLDEGKSPTGKPSAKRPT